MAMIAVRALVGGGFVAAFAVLAECLRPKRFAGLFAAAPSIALGSLTLTLTTQSAQHARLACEGMVAGAVAFLVFAVLLRRLLTRWTAIRASGGALLVWCSLGAAAVPLLK